MLAIGCSQWNERNDTRPRIACDGHLGRIHGGDRLPWVKTWDADNFVPLTALDWQVHVYGQAADELRRLCSARDLSLRVFPWEAGIARAGLHPHATYLVRPDGYIAMIDADGKGGR